MKPETEINSKSIPWSQIPSTTQGFKGSGVSQKILSQDSDNKDLCTRLLKIEPGHKNTEKLSHDFCEEIYVIEGSIVDDETGKTIEAGHYWCRPPNQLHGVSHSDTGALLIEFRHKA